jgi:hypothetical protein
MGTSGVFIKGGFEGLENKRSTLFPTLTHLKAVILNPLLSEAKININNKSAYPNWPIQTPAENIHTLPEKNSEPVTRMRVILKK